MKQSTEPRSDRIVSILLSVLVHAVIVGALLWGWWHYRPPKEVPQTLAIQATVVRTTPQPAESAPAPPPSLPPPDAQAQQQQARERAEAQQAQQQRAAAAAAQAEARAEAQAQAQAKATAAAAKAEAERQADEAEEAKAAARKVQEQVQLKAKQDAAREAQVLAQQLKVEQAEQQREADLRAQLKAEEHLDAVESSPAKAEYLALIQARISRAWIRPPSAQPGVKCTVHLAQIPGGEITHVTVEGCNGDEAVRQSVQTAAYRASPLPAPPDPALFDPNITVTFAPDQ